MLFNGLEKPTLKIEAACWIDHSTHYQIEVVWNDSGNELHHRLCCFFSQNRFLCSIEFCGVLFPSVDLHCSRHAWNFVLSERSVKIFGFFGENLSVRVKKIKMLLRDAMNLNQEFHYFLQIRDGVHQIMTKFECRIHRLVQTLNQRFDGLFGKLFAVPPQHEFRNKTQCHIVDWNSGVRAVEFVLHYPLIFTISRDFHSTEMVQVFSFVRGLFLFLFLNLAAFPGSFGLFARFVILMRFGFLTSFGFFLRMLILKKLAFWLDSLHTILINTSAWR